MTAGAQVVTLDVLRVFADGEGRFGNPLGVFLDGSDLPPGQCQPIATALGHSETVFVHDLRRRELRMFTPTQELPFAGHPVVGVAGLMMARDRSIRFLRPHGSICVRPRSGLGRAWRLG